MIVINTAALPRSFRNDRGYNVKDYAAYYHNKSAWMTKDIFGDYLVSWDKELRNNSRKIVLLVDNAKCHLLPDGVSLTNINLQYLDPNTTSRVQPLD